MNNIIIFYSSGYVGELFKIFINKKEFYLIWKKILESILSKQKFENIIEPFYHFLIINEGNITFKTILKNLIINAKIYLHIYVNIKNNDGLLTTKIIYTITNSRFFFGLIDMNYNVMNNIKSDIIILSKKGINFRFYFVHLMIIIYR